MTRALKYPKANTTAQWFEDKFPRVTMNPVSKLLLHTTESGKGWPGYDSGAVAPTITYNPWLPASQRWRQHCYLDRSARSLRDPSNTVVRENQDGVVQVEICCYCDPVLGKARGYFVGDLPDHAYEDLGEFLAYLHTHCAVPLIRAGEWDTFPPSDSIRMDGPEYDKFRGLLGHQHASGNTHGDPGMTNAQVDRILAVAHRLTAPSTPSLPEDKVTPTDIAAIADAVYAKIEPRLKAYTADLKKYEVQTDGPDAVRAGRAAEAEILTPENIDLIATAVAAKLTPKG
jgi:hypothetical protein